MPSCYFLALASDSSLDRDTNNFSLFKLTEEMQITISGTPPQGPVLPIELHAYWMFEPGEIGRSFEFQFLFEKPEAGVKSEPIPLQSDKKRLRVRNRGLPVLPNGEFRVRTQWRAVGENEWHLEPQIWPVEVKRVQQLDSEAPTNT